MELRHLRALVAVADERNFTRAGDRLHLSQPAVSSTVRALEQELGTILVDRTQSPVQLTDAGLALVAEARRTLASADAALQAVYRLSGGLRGSLRMGIMPSRRVRRGGFAEIAKTFSARYPDVALSITMSGPPLVAARHVADGLLDLAFVSITGIEVPGTRLRPVFSEPIVLVCHRTHPLAERDHVSLVELHGRPFADVPASSGSRMILDPILAAVGIERDLRYEVNDHTAVTDFVAQDLAIAILPASFVQPHLDVRTVSLQDAPDFVISVALPADRPLGEATRAMLEIIGEFATFQPDLSSVSLGEQL